MYMPDSLIDYTYEGEGALRRYLQAEGWSDPAHLASLYRHVHEDVPDGGLIVEIGCNLGESTIVMGHGIRGSSRRIITIDPVFRFASLEVPDDYSPVGNHVYVSKILAVLGEITSHRLGGYISIVPDYSWNVLERWDDRKIDLLFVDGEHTYAAVQKDCGWMDHVRVGGFALFDDYYPNIERAVREYCQEHSGWESISVDRAAAFRKNHE